MSLNQRPKILTSVPKEVMLQMRYVWEHTLLSSSHPAGSTTLSSVPLYPKTQVSAGEARSDRNVGMPGINPPASLGLRIWRAGVERVDPIYGQPIGQEFEAPYVTMGVLKYDATSNRDLSQGEWGQQLSNTGELHIPYYHHLINQLPMPQEGDLVEVWAQSWELLGTFYNIIKVDPAGRIQGGPYYTRWQLQLERREEFLPERRLLGCR
jgi:hypothetical protein